MDITLDNTPSTLINDSETSYTVLLKKHCTFWDFTQHRVRYKAVVSLVALPIRPIAPQTRHSPSFAPSIDVSITIYNKKESVDCGVMQIRQNLCSTLIFHCPTFLASPWKITNYCTTSHYRAIVTWKNWDTATMGHFQVLAFFMKKSPSIFRFLF